MKIETRKVDEKRCILQITTSDSRWYYYNDTYLPSVTWICHAGLPKGAGYERWLAEKGIDEAEAVRNAAADKGSKVHQAISHVLNGGSVKIDDKYSSDGKEAEELTAEEYEAIMSFVNWLNETQPEVLKVDYTMVNEEEGYAGTIDMKLKIGEEIYIVDIKTSKDVYLSHEAQVSAYLEADKKDKEPATKVAILQVGYARNKNKYKFTEIEPCYGVFKAAKDIWAVENARKQPPQKDFPIELKWTKTK